MNVGQTETFSIGAPGFTPGPITASTDTPGIAAVTMNPDGSGQAVGLAPGAVTFTFSASGYRPVNHQFSVAPQPQLVFTPGTVS